MSKSIIGVEGVIDSDPIKRSSWFAATCFALAPTCLERDINDAVKQKTVQVPFRSSIQEYPE